jgi:hypothetical protein
MSPEFITGIHVCSRPADQAASRQRGNRVYVTGIHRNSEWADIIKAKPDHMRLSLTLRRNGIVADAWHHLLDTRSYNDNNMYGAQLPLFDYDINKDIAEKELPENWPEENPEEDGQIV